MRAPIGISAPYLVIAQHYGVPYGMVLLMADGFSRKPNSPLPVNWYWQTAAWQQWRALPKDIATPLREDIAETYDRIRGML